MLKFKIKIPPYNINTIFYISDDLTEPINLIKEKYDKDKLYKLPKKELNKLCGVVIDKLLQIGETFYYQKNKEIKIKTI